METPPKNHTVSTIKQDEITLKDVILKISQWLKLLRSKWLLIMAACVIGALLGVAYSFFKKPIYKADLSFALEDDKSTSIGGAASLASQFGFDLGGGMSGAFSGDNLLELMKSRSMLEKTLLTTVKINGKQETLANLYISFNKLHEKWGDEPELNTINFPINADRSKFSLKQDSVLGLFYNSIIKYNLTVNKTDKKLNIINLTVTSKNELFSKFLAEVLARVVSDFYVETKTKKSVRNVAILQHQTDSVRRELNSSINGVATSLDATPNANPGRLLLKAPSQHRQVDVQANQAILTELVRNLEVAKIGLRKETPLIQVIDMPILPLENDKTGKLKGLALGAVLSALLMIMYITIKRLYQVIMS